MIPSLAQSRAGGAGDRQPDSDASGTDPRGGYGIKVRDGRDEMVGLGAGGC
jgi:hypothetical protein